MMLFPFGMRIMSDIEKVENIESSIQPIASRNELEKDYEYTRGTLQELIEQGREAIGDALLVAQNSEHPRAFEVVGGLIKNVSDVADKLIDLQKKMKDIENGESDNQKTPQNITNNAVFVGSTTDLFEKVLKNIES